MAKKKAEGVNRSQLIRDYKKSNAEAGPQAISQAMLADHGVKVSPQYVSTVLTNAKKKGGVVGRPGRRAGTNGAVSSIDSKKLLKAKELIELMGSASEAKAAISLIDQLIGS